VGLRRDGQLGAPAAGLLCDGRPARPGPGFGGHRRYHRRRASRRRRRDRWVGIQVFPQLASGALGTPTFTETPDNLRVRIGQLDGDGLLDVAGIGWGSNTVSVFANNGSGGLAAPVVYPARHGGWDDLDIADVTGDGLDDLVVMSGQTYAIPNLSVLAQLPAGGFGPAAEYRVADNTNTSGMGVGDVDGDARNDVVLSYGGNSPGAFVATYSQTESATLGLPVSYTSYDIPGPVEVADLDGDGHSDVVTIHEGWRKAGVYRGTAEGWLDDEELYPIPANSHYNPHGLAVGDVTGDGWLDLVLADPTNGLVIVPNSGPSVPLPTAPGAPTLTSATPGNGRVPLAWTAPTSNGGSPITSYTATASPGGASCTTAGLGCAVDGLTNGTTYTFTVRATNSVGTGPESNALTATPVDPGQPPSAPGGLTTSPNLAAGVGLSWTAPSSSGTAPISGYRIYRGNASGGETLLAIVGNVLTYLDTTVVNGGTYYYQVSAVNSVGEGPRSTEAVAQRGTAPSVPRTVAATAGGPGITVKWSSPATNGGSAVTGYRIYRATASGSETFLASAGPAATSYLDKNVVKRTRYFYWVTATNVLGESSPSNEVNAVAK
jgi:hypothetical protein